MSLMDKVQGCVTKPVSAPILRGRRAWLLVGCVLAGLTQPGYALTSVSRIDAYDYDSTTGLMVKHIVEPTNSNLCSSTTYSYDPNLGLLQSVTSKNCAAVASTYPGSSSSTNTEAAAPGTSSTAPFTVRTTSSVVTYSTDGTFKVVDTNAESEGETKLYGNAYGELKSNTDANQLLTSWQYDALGRKTLETRPDGTSTKWTYEYCTGFNGGSASCPTTLNTGNYQYSVAAYAHYVITEQPLGTDSKANGAYTKRYYDAYDRVIRVETQGFDANTDGTLLTAIKLIYQDTTYNSLGLVATISRPYYSSSTPVVDQYQYDNWGRVLKTIAADGSITSYNYSGLVRTITNTDSKTTIETKDESGQVVKITDAYSKDLKKSYDPFGNLTQTVDSAGNTVAMQYDARGRKYAMQDPDLGSWTYGYDALGNLVTQKDAASQTTTFTYDRVQRLTAKTEPTLNTYWYYTKGASGIACGLGVGKLCGAKANNGYDRRYDYDKFGRLDATATKVSSTSSWYVHAYGYDANGRLLEVDYPSGFSVQYAYTPLGYMWKMEDSVASPTAVYWRAQAMDAEMHLTQQVYGNGVSTTNAYFANNGRLKSTIASGNVQSVSYDYWPLGNLKTRNDNILGVNASYTYDDISRLKSETVTGSALSSPQVVSWDYDDIGNPQDRVDGSNYTYYGYTGTRPHAITAAAGNINGAALVYYFYDANGNLNRTSGSRSSTVTWTSFNMVDTINKTVGTKQSTLNFKYSPEHDRAQEIYTLNGVLQRTTTYLSPNAASGVILYEEERNELTQVTKKKNYLNVGDNTIGTITYTTGSATPAQQYWHKDNLGSVMVISDATGNAIERLAYEPFGKRRQNTGLTDTNGTLVATNTERGFTEHEMLDEVGLVNMNGRIYDPAVGRFLSADPTVPHPGDMQSYDRYSYARNNPTTEIDLTGFFDDCTNVLCGISGGTSTLPGLNGGGGLVNNGLCYGQSVQFCLGISGNNSGITGGVTVGSGSAPPSAIGFNNMLGTGSAPAQTFNQGQYSDSLGLNYVQSQSNQLPVSVITNPYFFINYYFYSQFLKIMDMCGVCNDPGVQITAATAMGPIGLLGPDEAMLLKNSGLLAAKGGRVFTSTDPLVGELATKIDALYPGHVVGVNVPVRNAAGQLVTDADILLQNAVIQVKSGGGKGMSSQLIRTEQATGLPTIGYGPDLKQSILRSCFSTNCESTLLDVIKP